MDTNTETTTVEGTKEAQVAASANTQEVESTKQAATKETTGNEAGPKEPKWTEEQEAYIKSLRGESAKYRTSNKELEAKFNALNERYSKIEGGLKGLFGDSEEEVPPEKQIESLSQANETLNFKSAVMEAAIEYGVGKDSMDYFSYLIEQKASGLEEGEELTEEDIDGIAQKAKSVSASTSTSVGGTDGAPQATTGSDSMDLEKFVQLSLAEKSLLFQKDPETYKTLAAQAKKEGKLI